MSKCCTRIYFYKDKNSFPTKGKKDIIYVDRSNTESHMWDGTDYVLMWQTVNEFLDLIDVPNDYTGEGSNLLSVKTSEDGIEFIELSSIDLSSFNIDIDTDDISEGNNLYYTEQRVSNNSDVALNTSARHTHNNKSAIDKVSDSGPDNKYLANDGTYKEIPWGEISGDIEDQSDLLPVINYVKNHVEESLFLQEENFELQEHFKYLSGDTKFPLDFDIQEITDVFVNGERVEDYTYAYNYVEISGVNTNDEILINYKHHCDFSKVYGIKKDKTIASPDWERIGNMSLHASLPVQSKIRRCVLNDDGTVNYYLDANDSTLKEDGITSANLDGTDGQYMVEIPKSFWRFNEYDNIRYIFMSEAPFPGAHISERCYVSVAEATLNRTNNKLSSVVSISPDYRGGNNNSSLDALPNSQLGMPATNISLANFRVYAQNRGSDWYAMEYEVRKIVTWMMVVEYSHTQMQREIDISLTPEGYKKGGLGNGPTTINSAQWNTFNERYPIIEIGATTSLGNRTGEIQVLLSDFPITGETRMITANSYRGIQNWFGHLYEYVDGIRFDSQNLGVDRYIFKAIGDAYSNSNFDGYKFLGKTPAGNGYITDIIFGKDGDIIPTSSTGGSSSTYYADYFYMDASVGLGVLAVSGRSNHGSPAGPFIVNSYRSPSNSFADFGSRLCRLNVKTKMII